MDTDFAALPYEIMPNETDAYDIGSEDFRYASIWGAQLFGETVYYGSNYTSLEATLNTIQSDAAISDEDIAENRNSIQTLNTNISNIVNGTTIVAEATKSTLDSNGDNIHENAVSFQANIDRLRGIARSYGQVNYTTANVTQAILNTQVLSVKETTAGNGDLVYDLDNHEWEYNGTTWVDNGEWKQSSIATTSELGVVLGSGDISVNATTGAVTVNHATNADLSTLATTATTANNALLLETHPASYFATQTDIEDMVEYALDNLVVNGDFSNGTTGWSFLSSSCTTSDNEITVTSTSTSVFGIWQVPTTAKIAGHSYLIILEVSYSDADNYLRINESNTSAQNFTNTVLDEFQPHSVVYEYIEGQSVNDTFYLRGNVTTETQFKLRNIQQYDVTKYVNAGMTDAQIETIVKGKNTPVETVYEIIGALNARIAALEA